jgi:hypothetical protein
MSMAAAFEEGLMLRLIWIELPSGSIWQASDSVDKEDFTSSKSRDREIVTVNLLACFADEDTSMFLLHKSRSFTYE